MLHLIVFTYLALWIFANVAMVKLKCHWVVFVLVNIAIAVLLGFLSDGLKANGI